MRKIIISLTMLFIFLLRHNIPYIKSCSEEQININTASKNELQKITNIGPAYSKQIIELRPFKKIDDLTKVSGIAENRLEQIKNQGLACIGENKTKTEEKADEEKNSYIENKTEEKKVDYDFNLSKETSKKENKNITGKTIKLSTSSGKENPKVIKNPNSSNFQQNKPKYAQYGLVAVVVIVISLMLIKTKKNRYKNEFREQY